MCTHLHFDHCGQNAALAAPVHVQAAERAAAVEPGFTVPAWATLPDERWRVVDGDAQLADGLRVVATPGHTPGHQSVLVSGGGETVALVGQCAYTAAEFGAGTVAEGDAHDGSWHATALDSLHRLRSIRPTRAVFSHDRAEWSPGPEL